MTATRITTTARTRTLPHRMVAWILWKLVNCSIIQNSHEYLWIGHESTATFKLPRITDKSGSNCQMQIRQIRRVFFPAKLLHWSGAARKTLNKFSRKANCVTLVLQKEEASESVLTGHWFQLRRPEIWHLCRDGNKPCLFKYHPQYFWRVWTVGTSGRCQRLYLLCQVAQYPCKHVAT